jgi:hypothetical protein
MTLKGGLPCLCPQSQNYQLRPCNVGSTPRGEAVAESFSIATRKPVRSQNVCARSIGTFRVASKQAVIEHLRRVIFSSTSATISLAYRRVFTRLLRTTRSPTAPPAVHVRNQLPVNELSLRASRRRALSRPRISERVRRSIANRRRMHSVTAMRPRKFKIAVRLREDR